MMYPLILKAPLKDYLWGGTRLIDEFGFEPNGNCAAEAWLLANNKDGQNTVLNGEYSGLTLKEALEKMGPDALGKKGVAFPYFPLLIKFIDAKDRLSLQVHPSDEYALSREGEFGKTEMWYVVDCDEGAQLIYGLNKSVTKEEFERRIKTNSLSEICNFVPVKKGDVFFIPSGTLHAIGKGILIAEVQQNSTCTYRVSDYGRLGADGKPRPLHISKAVDVTDLKPVTMPYGDVGEITLYPFGTVRNLAACDLFTADLLELNGKAGFSDKDSFTSLVIISGEAVLSYAGSSARVKKGDSIFIPANTRIALTGTATVLCSHV